MDTRKQQQRKQPKRSVRPRRRRAKENNSLIMPQRLNRTLRYVDSAYVRNAPGNAYLVYSFRINDLYDPDPLILSGSVSGFKELMLFYQNYRVLHSTITATISNLEAFPIMFGMVFSQNNLTGSITSRDDAMNALEGPMSTRARMLSAKGGIDRAKISKGMYLSRILGIPAQYKADIAYAGSGLATPSIPIWLNFIVASATGAVLTNGYCTTSTITFHAEFFGLTSLRT